MEKWFAIGGVLAVIVLSAQVSVSASESFQQAQMTGGPLAGITLKVVDEKNTEVPGASIEAHFENVPEKEVRTGKTDGRGIYYCEGRSIGDVWFGITKDGYYKTSQVYSFARNAPHWDKPTKPEKWIPWNPTFTVVLKKMNNPTAMYVKRAECIHIPIEQLVGFDLEVGECVAPYGKGVISDVIFRVARPKEPKSRRYSLGFSFSNPLDGIQFLKREAWSNFFSLYKAPEDGYVKVFEQVDQLFRDANPLDTTQWYYVFRIRTASVSGERLFERTVCQDDGPG